MLATRMAPTATSITDSRDPRSVAGTTARSFLQNSRATRLSAIGLTFQVSPEM